MLTIKCKKHPKYKAVRLPKDCIGCHLLFVLRHQEDDQIELTTGSRDPYQFIGDIEKSCYELEVSQK